MDVGFINGYPPHEGPRRRELWPVHRLVGYERSVHYEANSGGVSNYCWFHSWWYLAGQHICGQRYFA